jgi:hypothetical protein
MGLRPAEVYEPRGGGQDIYERFLAVTGLTLDAR